MNNSREKGLLWILGILAFAFIFGNMFLFTGDVFSGGDLENNPIGIGFVIIAILGDFALIFFVIGLIIRQIEKRREEKEKARIQALTQKINVIIDKNKPNIILDTKSAKRIDVPLNLINKEVINIVNEFKNNNIELIEKCINTDKKILDILSCKGYTSEDDKYKYLKSQEEVLMKLKKESDFLHGQLSKNKIQLLNEDEERIYEIKKAFNLLTQSQKCISDNYNITELVSKNAPTELSLFEYKHSPLILFFKNIYFCFFSNVILVFDYNGIFTTALDPTVLSITLNRYEESITIRNGNRTNFEYSDTDSKLIKKGNSRTTWLHTCRDGSPDLRYSHNPRIEYRTDTYEYGTVEIKIISKSVSFTVSSEKALNMLVLVQKNYVQQYNTLHNPTLDFVGLLQEILDSDNEYLQSIEEICKANSNNNNYFCKIVSK